MILSQEKEIQKALKKKKAREIACWFESYAQTTLSFEKFETEMGKDAVRRLEKMIAKGYIRNIQIDREENYILITAPNRRVNEKIYITVTCPSCGAKNQIIKGRLCNCDNCFFHDTPPVCRLTGLYLTAQGVSFDFICENGLL